MHSRVKTGPAVFNWMEVSGLHRKVWANQGVEDCLNPIIRKPAKVTAGRNVSVLEPTEQRAPHSQVSACLPLPLPTHLDLGFQGGRDGLSRLRWAVVQACYRPNICDRPPPNSICYSPPPTGMVWKRAFGWWSGTHETLKQRPSWGLVPPYKEQEWHVSPQRQRRGHVSIPWEESHLSVKRRGIRMKPTPSAPCMQTWSPQNWEAWPLLWEVPVPHSSQAQWDKALPV